MGHDWVIPFHEPVRFNNISRVSKTKEKDLELDTPARKILGRDMYTYLRDILAKAEIIFDCYHDHCTQLSLLW